MNDAGMASPNRTERALRSAVCRFACIAIFFGLLSGPLIGAGRARAQVVPGAFPFQGLLLDAAGQPVTDTVDLEFALFPVISGGTALWSESHPGVLAVDGVYSVNLGSVVPIDAGILSGGAVFLEIEVEGETLAPRQQLLSVPYARVAETAERVGGVPTLFLEQMIAGFAFDGGLPANDDPLEGTEDLDGDGQPNFLDADNDGDGFLDSQEVQAGSGVNLVTPGVVTVTPTSVSSFANTAFTVTGQNLAPLQSVQLGSQFVTPTSATATSLTFSAAPTNESPSVRVRVSLTNGEFGESPPITIATIPPTITAFNPVFLASGQATLLTITGTELVPGTRVEIGALDLTPNAATGTSLTVSIPALPDGNYALRVVHPNGLSASRTIYAASGTNAKLVFVTQGTWTGNLGGVAGADAKCQAEATAASVPGTFRAWISTASTSPAQRFSQTAGPYLLADGTLLATSWADLTDGTLLVPPRVPVAGAALPSFVRVWTGTQFNGTALTATADHCSGWTSTSGTGRQGYAHVASAWSDVFPSQSCGQTDVRLYCFQD